MTKKELSQLYYLNREIDIQKEKLHQLENPIKSPAITGMPRGINVSNQVANCVDEMEEQRQLIDLNVKKCMIEQNRLCRYINTIEDSLVRQILTCRYVNCLTWVQVAFRIGGSNTADGVRKVHDRFLSRN